MIDTPFGFQEKFDELVKKLKEFYQKSINIEIDLASFRDKKSINSINYFEMLEKLSESNFILLDQVVQVMHQKHGLNQGFQIYLKNI